MYCNWYTGLMIESKRRPNTECFLCKKAVYRRPFQIQNNGGKGFCSRECFGIFCRKEKHCKMCSVSILAGKNASTCSRACANRYRAGIKYKIGSRKDRVKDQRAIKIRLIAQRGMKCERCGYSKLEILHVHHRDRNRKNNDLNNLELICPNCHYEEHYLEKSWLSGSLSAEGSDSGSFQRT